MNEKYMPHYKWVKLSKADKDEFKYKFESKFKDAENMGKNAGRDILLAMMLTVLASITVSIFFLKNLSYIGLMKIGFFGILVALTEPFVQLLYLAKLRKDAEKWLEYKGL